MGSAPHAYGVPGYGVQDAGGSLILIRPDGSTAASFDYAVPPRMVKSIAETDAELYRLFAETMMRYSVDDLAGTMQTMSAVYAHMRKWRAALRGEGLGPGMAGPGRG